MTLPKSKKFHENKNLQNILLSVALIMGFVFLVSLAIYFIKNNYGLSCSCEVSLTIVIAILASLGVFVGILTYYFLSKSFFKEKEQLFVDVEKTLNFLDKEEKTILLILIENNGEILQNNINKKINMDSVKIHRRLLNLESKEIIKKEKKGMTNKIILREDFKNLFIK